MNLKQQIALMMLSVGLLGAARLATAQNAPAPAPAAPAVVTTQPAEPLAAPDAGGDWFDRSKNPVTWLKWGADLRLREIWSDNILTLNKNLPNHERHFQRFRTRLWSTVTPHKDVDINSRLVWEFRNYCKPETLNEVEVDEAIFDKLNVTWRNILGLPLTATVGRQDLMFGDNWLIFEGTPLDGSRTIFFDAARLTYDIKSAKTSVDLIYLNNHADSDWFVEPFNHQETPLIEQDEQGAILYVKNRSLKNTDIDGYFIYKHDELAAGAKHNTDPKLAHLRRGNEADIYTFGTRINHRFSNHWEARGELAGQFGNKNGQDLCALGFNGRTTYFFRDPHDNQLFLHYEYLSGDDPSTSENEAFDPLWGRWPQFSELYVYAYALETRIAEVTNLHRITPGWTVKPTKNTELCVNYSLLFADENTVAGRPGFSENGSFRGQLATALLRYKFTKHISGHLIGEFFFPGNYYTDYRNDPATFIRYELSFSW